MTSCFGQSKGTLNDVIKNDLAESGQILIQFTSNHTNLASCFGQPKGTWFLNWNLMPNKYKLKWTLVKLIRNHSSKKYTTMLVLRIVSKMSTANQIAKKPP